MSKKENFLWLLAALAGTFGIFAKLMRGRLFELGSKMHVSGGDGLKNYFTLAYQYKWGESWWFDGMHYPYGEYAIYTDAQLSLVTILQGLRAIGIDSEEHLLLIVQGLPVALFSLICFFTFKIGVHYGLSKPFAFFLGIIAVSFSPNLHRLTSHFGLAYGFFIPALWYFIIKTEEKVKLIYILLACFYLLAAGYFHPYWLLILVLFCGAYFAFTLLIKRKIRWDLLIMASVPIISFLIINKWMDPVSDRPDNPWGMNVYKTTIASLTSPRGFIFELLKPILIKKRSIEGDAYIGPLLYVLPLLLLGLTITYRKSLSSLKAAFTIPASLKISMWTGLSMLFLAMGLHISLGGDFILDLLPPLKQFRSIGRFAWIFYYIFIVLSGVIYSQSIALVKNKKIRYAIGFIFVVIALIEINQYHNHLDEAYKAGSSDWLKTETTIGDILKESRKSPDDFQVLWTLPPSIEGAEKIAKHDRWTIRKVSMPFLYQTGMKSTLTVMSRTSIGQSMKILQLGSGPSIRKEILDDLEDDRPFLTIANEEDISTFSAVLSKSTLLGQKDKLRLFETPLSAFEQDIYNPGSSKPLILQEMPMINQDSILYYDNFSRETHDGFLSNGCSYTDENLEVKYFEIPINIDTATAIELSFWVKVQPKKSDAIAYQFKAKDEKGGSIFEMNKREYDSAQFDIYHDWVRIHVERTLPAKTKKIHLKIYNKYHYVDEILCTIKGYEPIISLKDGYVLKGHRLFDTKSD